MTEQQASSLGYLVGSAIMFVFRVLALWVVWPYAAAPLGLPTKLGLGASAAIVYVAGLLFQQRHQPPKAP